MSSKISKLLVCLIATLWYSPTASSFPFPFDDRTEQDPIAPCWQEIEIQFEVAGEYTNPYLDVDAWVDFQHQDGTLLRRPIFWAGGKVFCVRFSSNKSSGNWHWTATDSQADPGIHKKTGRLKAIPNQAQQPTHFDRHGFWQIPPGGRNLVHPDGTARLICADTPWALPWRATPENALVYALDRQQKGFNAALLMTVQPDMKAEGPRSRTEDLGFDVGFEDLAQGKLTRLNPDYFEKLDQLISILVSHGIAPVYQPVFHGYGWKGREVAGNVVSQEDYARYCRYLVARYGARPAIWLIGGDGPATDPRILEKLDLAGQTIRLWDAYRQPIGLHYSPHALNRSHQDKDWLDFQWCQTGHNGEHVPERVADMWRNLPVKGVANGEPTYENIGQTGKAAGWWQGHEAWCNLTAGGTMGIIYGAASLWQWRLHPDEPDHADWCTAPNAGWREALAFEGSNYPGIITKIFEGLPLEGMEPNWIYTYGRRGLAVPGKLFVLYLSNGGDLQILSQDVPRNYRVYDPKTGDVLSSGRLANSTVTMAKIESGGSPCVVVFSSTFDDPAAD